MAKKSFLERLGIIEPVVSEDSGKSSEENLVSESSDVIEDEIHSHDVDDAQLFNDSDVDYVSDEYDEDFHGEDYDAEDYNGEEQNEYDLNSTSFYENH